MQYVYGIAYITVRVFHRLKPPVALLFRYRPVLLLLTGQHGVFPLGTVKSHLPEQKTFTILYHDFEKVMGQV
jgi:hypothetical protein